MPKFNEQPQQPDLSLNGLNFMTSMSRLYDMEKIMQNLDEAKEGDGVRKPSFLDIFSYNHRGSTSINRSFYHRQPEG
jgi:hypothetical protein